MNTVKPVMQDHHKNVPQKWSYMTGELSFEVQMYAGFPPYLVNLENLVFCHFLFQSWKMSGICFKKKMVKTWNFNSKHGKNLQFANSMLQASLFKMSFTKIILIYFVISTFIINKH